MARNVKAREADDEFDQLLAEDSPPDEIEEEKEQADDSESEIEGEPTTDAEVKTEEVEQAFKLQLKTLCERAERSPSLRGLGTYMASFQHCAVLEQAEYAAIISRHRRVWRIRLTWEKSRHFELHWSGQDERKRSEHQAACWRCGTLQRAFAPTRRDEERLVRGSYKLAAFFVKKFFSWTPLNLREDAVQEALIAIRSHAWRYDETRGFTFATYFSWRIRQKVGRFFADRGFRGATRLPVHMDDAVWKVKKTVREIIARDADHRFPSAQEIASRLGMEEKQVANILNARRIRDETKSLQSRKMYSGGDDDGVEFGELVPDRVTLDPYTASRMAEARELLERLETALDRICGRLFQSYHAQILRSRLGLGCKPLTLKEAAAPYGLTRERTRQLEKRFTSFIIWPYLGPFSIIEIKLMLHLLRDLREPLSARSWRDSLLTAMESKLVILSERLESDEFKDKFVKLMQADEREIRKLRGQRLYVQPGVKEKPAPVVVPPPEVVYVPVPRRKLKTSPEFVALYARLTSTLERLKQRADELSDRQFRREQLIRRIARLMADSSELEKEILQLVAI